MKTLNTILTVLFWAALVIGLIPTISTFGMLSSNASGPAAAGIIFGNLLAYATVPGIIWVIRYFVRKNINESQNADTGTK